MEENRALRCHGIFGADDGEDEEDRKSSERDGEEDDPEEEEPVWTAGTDSAGER